MTLPASGSISISDVLVETGNPATTSVGLDWVKANTRSNYQPTYANLDSVHGYAYYNNNSYNANCANGNCTSGGGNCGDQNCVNCYLIAIDCGVADSRSWLQPNCNCACSYNCNQGTWSYNCNCNCPWFCACACW